MTKSVFIDLISHGAILADGAMGTMLHAHGIGFDKCFDELNLTHPSTVAEIHRAYIEAGAQLIITNTFGANRFKLAKHGLEDHILQINRASVVLAEAGADLIVLETFTDLYEIREAIKAAKEVCHLPVIASVTFTRDDRTVLGDDPAKVARALREEKADVIGVNCSGGPAQLSRILKQMSQAIPDGLFWVKPNAGWPEQVGGRIMYPADADYFGEYALSFREIGARIIGGCCGTTPQHIAAMRKAFDTAPHREPPQISALPQEEITETAQELPTPFAQKLNSGGFAISVEMDPPRGLSTHKLLAGASLLADAGADVINVADSPMERM